MSSAIASEKYGTFKGVFLPTLLAVFGVILFLRLGWMVGNVGIHTTLFIIFLALVVAGLTVLSISATVSNMRVGGGGAYYIISRSLGIEVGAALGLLLFFAQAIGISFYLNGFAESFSILFPIVSEKLVSVLALIVLGGLGYFSANFLVRVPASLSLFAALLSVLIMIMINAGAGISAIFVTILIYYVMLRRRINTNWGDARQGILMLLARYIIHRLQENKPSPYSWKPNFLVMVPGPSTGWPLIEFANHLSQNSGFITTATALSIDTSQERIQTLEEAMRKHLQDKDIFSLVRIYQGASWYQVAERLILFYGIGRIVPDTIVIGAPQIDSINADLYRLIKFAHEQHRNILLLNQSLKDIGEKKAKKKMMIWWGGKRHNGSLMIALSNLLQRSSFWDDSSITLCSAVDNVKQQDELKLRLRDFAYKSRITVDIEVICNSQNTPILQVIAEKSKDADIIFIGVRPPGKDELEVDYLAYIRKLFGSLAQLESICFVMAGDEVRTSRIFS